MKFVKAEAFDKHLEEALPEHPSSLYAVTVADPFERKFVVENLLEKMKGEVSRYQTPETFLEELKTQSLFSQERTLIYEGVEKIKKDQFVADLKNLPEGVRVILTGSALPFYEALKKELVALDLSGEKPWERESRLKRWLLKAVQKEGKTLSPEASTYLAEFCSFNFESLMKEVEKLVLYVGDSKVIDLNAVEELCSLDVSANGWQLSEAIVWGGSVHHDSLHRLEGAAAQQFLGQLRYQIQLGLIIASCCERKEEHVIAEEYPKLRANTLEKCKRLAKQLKSPYFRKALQDLFDLELRLRMKTASAPLLFDDFVAHLKKRRVNG